MENANTEQSLYGFEFRDVDHRRTDRPAAYDVKQLWQRTHEIIDLALQGWKQTDIARMLGVTPVTVSNAVNSTLGKMKLAKMREARDGEYVKLNEEVRDLTEKALMVYNQILDDESGNVTQKLKKETADTIVLDLSGLRVATKVDTRSVHTVATLEEIEEFKRRGIEAARQSGKLIDIPGEGSNEPEKG